MQVAADAPEPQAVAVVQEGAVVQEVAVPPAPQAVAVMQVAAGRNPVVRVPELSVRELFAALPAQERGVLMEDLVSSLGNLNIPPRTPPPS